MRHLKKVVFFNISSLFNKLYQLKFTILTISKNVFRDESD